MEQHPIPQQISSYQFKLVGDMTLKQFFQVAGGVVIGLIFYSTSLHPVIKWPLIFLFVGLGAAMAFLPFEERPLEKWIIAFFRSIYSPTLFYWKKTEKAPVFFTEEAPAPEIQNISTPEQKTNSSQLEEAEKNFLSKFSSLLNTTTSTASSIPVPTQNAPVVNNIPSIQFTSNNPTTTTQPTVTPSPAPVKNDVSVPQQIPTVITKSAPRLVVEETKSSSSTKPLTTQIEGQQLIEKQISSASVEFSVDAAPPYPPTVSNTIVGQVMDSQRKIIEGAILEIRDSNGRPVRALKSNKAGHFIIVTPLANGRYEIITEKDGFNFKPVSFEAKGELIPPIAIKSK